MAALALAYPGIAVEGMTVNPPGAAMDVEGIDRLVDDVQAGDRP